MQSEDSQDTTGFYSPGRLSEGENEETRRGVAEDQLGVQHALDWDV